MRMIIILVSMEWIAIPFALRRRSSRRSPAARWRCGSRHSLPTLMALTGGIVVAVALFDVLPESIDAVDDSQRVATLVGVGFIAFFLAERVLVLHHRDDAEHARAHAQVGVLGALGLSVHSFIDGLGIGLAFGLDTATGVLVFIAVVSHDFADGLNTVSFVLSQSDDRRQAKRWLTIDAFAPLFGAIVGSAITISEFALGELLAALRRLLHLHGGDRPAPRGPRRARLVGAGGADRRRLRGDLRDHPGRRRLTRLAVGLREQEEAERGEADHQRQHPVLRAGGELRRRRRPSAPGRGRATSAVT